ncbi:hypothetical protein IMZ31_23715 (plasmid) [Pontibacillus sp. ALD_SL1]|uniref:hypothetical protein n=1 Tax=Pontibacillus sp. ALD_SL1 TaxID=2777185 RepID=UPI001A9602B3|nr:hypothetical protein [Pontibacillus sp. ALD_SL1]QST02460.1 hypothetical protein IMZ31_23715 [Pontibacillus sp. ALD_SL1]
MLQEREIVLCKAIHENPLDFKKGFRDHSYLSKDGTMYAVFTKEESLDEIITYFKENTEGYVFSKSFLVYTVGIPKPILEASDVEFSDGEALNTPQLLRLIEKTVGLRYFAECCARHNGGYGYYISAVHGKEVRQDGYYVYKFE